jgi:1-pyrroline-5-carboxylate dehydrogenase
MATKITYSTMSADDPQLQAAYDHAVEQIRPSLGTHQPFFVNGQERFTEDIYTELSPIDSEIIIGRFSQASAADADEAVRAAAAFQPEWEALGWQRRVELMLEAGDLMESEMFELAALVAFEVGKSRLEALGDVAETVEFFRYHSSQLVANEGFVRPLGQLSASEKNVSVMRPHGVWGVISPFNFPMALAAGPTIAALLTGNTVVLKPSNVGALAGIEFYRLLRRAGIPKGAVHLLTGAGSKVGSALVAHPGVKGFTFTGSYDVGMSIFRNFSSDIPKPVLAEMGGKNPAIVTATADLDAAAEGVMRGAFGFSGQKCSATSRVYVERAVYDEFVDKLVEKTAKLKVGNPIEADVFTGPVIDEAAVARFGEAVEETGRSGGTVLAGGHLLAEGDLARGHYLEPTVVTAPMDSWVWSRELFMPFLVVGPVDSLDEAIQRANDTEYGLTAGVFAGTKQELDTFFSRIEAGVTYANRKAGATTGAWPGIQSFGGWKGSGTTGTGFSPWYLRQYLREQSRTVVE